MSLKDKSTPENRAYWAFVERVAKEARRSVYPPCKECGRELHALNVSGVRDLCRFCAPSWAQTVIIG